MNVDELNSTLSRKAIPKSAPKWAKKNALATVSTVVTTLAAAVAIFAWLGLKPAIPLGWDEAYVTHEQFNLLLVSIVKSVEKIETEKQLVELLDFNIDYGEGFLFGEPRRSDEQ